MRLRGDRGVPRRTCATSGRLRLRPHRLPAEPGPAHHQRLRRAPEVFIPIQCEYYALEGLSQLLKNIELIRGHLNPDLHVSTILLTMYDGRTRLSSQVADEVRTHFPDQVLRTAFPARCGLRGAQLRRDRDDLRPQRAAALSPTSRRPASSPTAAPPPPSTSRVDAEREEHR